MKKSIFCCLLLLATLSQMSAVLAQEGFTPPSPSAISMIKASQTDVNLYTGKANVNIPIYTVKEGSLSVNISLKYVGGSGLKVQEIPSEAGLGWSLMAGGLITRSNRGAASGSANTGYLKSNPSLSDLQNAIASFADLEPDVFNSTMGGRIIFDENQKPQFMNEQGFMIQHDGVFSTDRVWIIADTRGNKYYFGETDASRERIVVTPVGGVPSLSVSCSSWYLSKMVSAKGDLIQFEYEKSGKLNQFNYYKFYRVNNPSTNGGWNNNISTLPNPTQEIHLSKIKTSNATIQFLYSDRQDFTNSKAISEIRVLDTKDKLLTKFVFETDYFRSTDAAPTLRLKMKAVKQYNSGSDEAHLIAGFDYNELENLPAGNSEKFDHWGYYNNNATGKYFLSEGANKLADLGKCQANILTGIRWPTGGSTKYVYELNSYRKDGVDYSGGGLRVGTFSEVNSDNMSKTTKYDYTSTSSGAIATSGLLHTWFDITKGYTYEYKNVNRSWTDQDEVYKEENALPLSRAIDLDGILIGYSQVTVIHPDQSSEEYSFRDYAHFPDEVKAYSYVKFFFANPSKVEDLLLTSNSSQYNGFKSITSNALQRGLITNKAIRNEKHDLIKSTQYKYNVFTGAEIPGFEGRLVYTFTPPGDLRNNRDYYLGSLYYERVMAVRLTETKEDNYFPGTSLPARSITITNDYKDTVRPFLLSTQTQKQSDETISIVGYNYPADMVSLGRDQTGIYSEMATNNIISPVIEQTETTDGKQVSFTRTNYDRFNSNNLLLPKSVEVQNGNAPLETRMLFTGYDLNGNLLEQQQSDGIRNSYLWGYNGQYPIARITNAVNKKSTSTELTKSSTLTINAPNSSKGVTFTTTKAGNLIIYPNYGGDPGQSYTMRYSLSGGTNSSGDICVYRGQNLPSGWCTSTTPNITIYLAAGTYTMTISNLNSTNPVPIGTLYFTYPSIETTYSNADFFYEGFEDNTALNVISGKAHTGEKYWNGNYTTNVNLNGGRNYVIQWWNFENNSWKFNEQAFTANLTLTGIIDDIRIFPKDAQITTSTYQPLIGMTSSTDTKGLTTYYDYDGFQRLKNVRDMNQNIIKNVKYNYPEPAVYSNDLQSKPFLKVCPIGQTGSWVTYTVPAGKYTSTSRDEPNAKALADINLNGQNYANQNGTCTASIFTVTATSTQSSPWTIVMNLVNKSTNESYLVMAGAKAVRTASVPAGEYRLDVTWVPGPEAGKYYLIGLNGNTQEISTGFGSSSSFNITINSNYSITAKYR